MPTATYTPLATITLGSSASSVTFSNIPSTYRDLILIVNGTVTGTGTFFLKLNNDSANATGVYMYGDGSGYASFTDTQPSWAAWIAGENHFAQFQVMDYSATDKHKTTIGRVNRVIALAGANRWASTAAVSSVVASLTSNSFASGTTFALYGVIA